MLSNILNSHERSKKHMATHPNSSTIRASQSVIMEEDLDEMRELLHLVQERMDKASADGRVYVMGQYVKIVAQMRSEISRVERRFHRETIAAARKEHQLLKLQQKGSGEAE
jgi:hypothetical protein